MTPIISVVGTSGSGKTTLLEKLIPELKSRGYRLAVVKHDAHSFEIDHEGKDSWRLKAAGADVVVISSPAKIAMIEDTHKDHTLEEISHRIANRVDIIISEGFKRAPHPKIEVFRAAHGRGLLCTSQDNILAIASDVPLKTEVPCVHIDDVKSLADLIERRFLGNKEDMG
ncbi:MAG: molybdopterin-guanine dinucleotide biosynthesis protein B [Thermodesulfobacteriota bacterium]